MADDMSVDAKRHAPRRRNKDTKKAINIAAEGDLATAESRAPDQPWMTMDEKWEPEIKAIFVAMQQDTMAQFMTPVAWAQLFLKCSAWDKEFKVKFLGISKEGDIVKGKAPVPPQVLADISRTLDSFGGSEKARRDMKILIDPTPTNDAAKAGGDAKMAAREAIARPARRALGR